MNVPLYHYSCDHGAAGIRKDGRAGHWPCPTGIVCGDCPPAARCAHQASIDPTLAELGAQLATLGIEER